jgi:RDD family protein
VGGISSPYLACFLRVTLPHVASPDAERHYPGQRRGLPANGPGSVAGWGRRIVALAIDWALSLLVTSFVRQTGIWDGPGAREWGPLIIFALEAWVLTTLLGGSAGQLIVGVVVRRTSGAPLDAARAMLRTVLICLVVPPVIYNRDQQGLHDLAVDSIALRR